MFVEFRKIPETKSGIRIESIGCLNECPLLAAEIIKYAADKTNESIDSILNQVQENLKL